MNLCQVIMQTLETDTEMTYILELSKTFTISMLKDLVEEKANMHEQSSQNFSRKMKTIKGGKIENLELKSLVSEMKNSLSVDMKRQKTEAVNLIIGQ